MKAARVSSYTRYLVIAGIVISCSLAATCAGAQTIDPELRPDLTRALAAPAETANQGEGRPNGYAPAPKLRTMRPVEAGRSPAKTSHSPNTPNSPATTAIQPGTPLTQILHTSQLSLSSSAGTDEQFVDRNGNLVADERTTFDSTGGSFDIAVGRSGARYEVYSATLNNNLVGVLVVALDTNGDYQRDSSTSYNLRTDFSLRSAAAVVTGVSKAGREFVIISSSGYYNSADPNDPNNEPSPGVILLVRDPSTGGFDNSRTRTLVSVGDNRLYNANALALLPNNELLIADFHSNELRIVRDTDNDGVPDTLSTTPYYSYRFSNDQPLEVAVNSFGVVFSHSTGNNVVMLVLYDDNNDGEADRDEVCVEGLSIDNNLFLHGLTVDGPGNVYVIEDASGPADGAEGNGGTPRIDGFPDRFHDGFLSDGAIFTTADDAVSRGLSGLGFGALPPNRIDDPQFFVTQHYRDFLNREPDASGLAFWVNEITSCGTDAECIQLKRINVSAAFYLSIEFQDTGYLVERIYKTAYGNATGTSTFGGNHNLPVPIVRLTEFLPDTQQLGSGVVVGQLGWEQVLENNKQAFTAEFVTRSRFGLTFPSQVTPAQFVDALNANAGNPLSQSERDQLVSELTSGAKTRAQVLRGVAEDSDLNNSEKNRAFVLMQYFGYLRRNPNDPQDTDYTGFDFWLTKLNEFNGNFVNADMVKAFITSGEYRHRFGQ